MAAKIITKQSAPVLGEISGKWCAAFENWRHPDDGSEPYMMSSVLSAALFDTAADADEAGKRAVAMLEATGKYPNMCEKF